MTFGREGAVMPGREDNTARPCGTIARIMSGTSLDVSAAGSGVQVFEAKQRVGLQAAAFIAGGVLFFLMLIVQFLIALGSKSTPTSDMMPGIIGGLSVFGVALIGRGIFLLRGVTRVVLEHGGVRVEGFIRSE